MRKIINYLAIFLLLIAIQANAAGNFAVIAAGGASSGTVYGCASCTYDLRLDDNAASTAVVNNNNAGVTDWVSSVNSADLHSATATEGTGSFLIDASTDRIYAPAAWTSEKFQVTFYMKLVSADAPATSGVIWSIGTGAMPTVTNNVMGFYRNTSNTMSLVMKGLGGTGYTWISTNWTPDTNWHKYVFTVDASTAPWTTVSLTIDGTTFTWDTADKPTEAATFASPMHFGSSTASRQLNGYIDVITVADQS